MSASEPAANEMIDFIVDTVDMLIPEESKEVIRFIKMTHNIDALCDTSEGVALNLAKLDVPILRVVYEMFLRFKEAAGNAESINFE